MGSGVAEYFEVFAKSCKIFGIEFAASLAKGLLFVVVWGGDGVEGLWKWLVMRFWRDSSKGRGQQFSEPETAGEPAKEKRMGKKRFYAVFAAEPFTFHYNAKGRVVSAGVDGVRRATCANSVQHFISLGLSVEEAELAEIERTDTSAVVEVYPTAAEALAAIREA